MTDAGAGSGSEDRVLVLGPVGRDASIDLELLSRAGIRVQVCTSVGDIGEALAAGAGALLLTEEALSPAAMQALLDILAHQPAWSDVPVVVLVTGGGDPTFGHANIAALTGGAVNVTLLERTVRATTLACALRTALRSRRWQYQLRDQIDALTRAESHERRALERARHLQQLTVQLGRNVSTEALFDQIIDALAELLGASILGLYLLDDPRADFKSVAARGLDSDEAGNYLPRDRSLAGRAVDQRRSLAVDDVTLDQYVMLPRLIGGPPVGAVAVAPIIAEDEPIGALEVYSASPRHWDVEDIDLLTTFAAAAAVAITNLRHHQQEQRAIQARDDFLAAASHDLKNPLTAIRGSAQMLERMLTRAGSIQPERLMQATGTIGRAAARMTALIDELLDSARLQMGEPLRLERTPTDLVKLIKDQAAMQQATTDRHRLVVNAPLPELVGNWDRRRVERVIENLLSNAIKYSPAGGEITVRVDTEPEESGTVLSVRDHGIGIPAVDLPHIFERFRRAGNVLGRIDGTGIGLSATAEIVREHGGSIDVQSREGEGTEVTVHLPPHTIDPSDAQARSGNDAIAR